MTISKFYDTVSLADVNEIVPRFSNHDVALIHLSEEDVFAVLRDADNALVVNADGENGLPALLDEIQAVPNGYGVSLPSAQRVFVNVRISPGSDLSMSDILPLSDFFVQFLPNSEITWGIEEDATLSGETVGVDMLCVNLNKISQTNSGNRHIIDHLGTEETLRQHH